MSLPKLNDIPKYELTIPSTGKTVRFRPYLVKEEKVLMMAFESGDKKHTVQAILDIISACIDKKSRVNVDKLATFDVEYIFARLRSKSAGETAKINVQCNKKIEEETCGHRNTITVDLDAIDMTVPKGSNVIKLTDNISVKLKYPTFAMLLSDKFDLDKIESETEMMKVVALSIDSVLTKDEKISASDVSDEEMQEFMESFTKEQLEKVLEFFKSIPKMETTIDFKCQNCQQDNKITLSGMNDFF